MDAFGPDEVEIFQLLATDVVVALSAIEEADRRRTLLEALAQSERRFRETLAEVNLVAMILDPHGTVEFANRFFLELTGWDEAEVIGHDYFDRFIPAEDRAAGREELAAAYERGTLAPGLRNRIVIRDGTTHEMEWSSTLLRGESGAIVGLSGIGQDVTARHRADFEMRRLALAIEQSADSVVITDVAGRIEYVNPAFERVSGYTRAEVIGQNPRVVKSGVQEPAFYAAMWAALTSGQPFTATSPTGARTAACSTRRASSRRSSTRPARSPATSRSSAT